MSQPPPGVGRFGGRGAGSSRGLYNRNTGRGRSREKGGAEKRLGDPAAERRGTDTGGGSKGRYSSTRARRSASHTGAGGSVSGDGVGIILRDAGARLWAGPGGFNDPAASWEIARAQRTLPSAARDGRGTMRVSEGETVTGGG